ncbi:SMN complex gem-associated protein 7, partial [Trinorchestia longiramus]
ILYGFREILTRFEKINKEESLVATASNMSAELPDLETHANQGLILQRQSSDDTSQNDEDLSSSISVSDHKENNSASTSIESSTPVENLEKTSTSLQSKGPIEDYSNSSLPLAPGKDIDIRYDDVDRRGNKDHIDPEVQECRARLRERFMWAVTGLNGKPVSVDMMDSVRVSGVLRGVDKDGLLVHIEKLQTPTVVHPWATLRLPDCLALHFPAS